MKKGELKILVAGLGVAALTLQSCGTYEDGPGISLRSKDSRLTGEWKLVSVLGITPEGVTTYEFESDGKYTYSYDYETLSGSDTSIVETGTWEWADGKEAVTLELDGEDPSTITIKRLTNSEMTFSYTDPFFGLTLDAEFEKQ